MITLSTRLGERTFLPFKNESSITNAYAINAGMRNELPSTTEPKPA